MDRVGQFHLAGHTHLGSPILDPHKGPIIDKVWELYAATIELTGAVSTLIEWDEDIPSWAALSAEAEKARTLRASVLQRRGATAGPQ